MAYIELEYSNNNVKVKIELDKDDPDPGSTMVKLMQTMQPEIRNYLGSPQYFLTEPMASPRVT